MRESVRELESKLAACPHAGTKWRHYKGGLYEVVGSAVLESTLGPLVLYRPRGEQLVFARTLADWTAEVEVDGTGVRRFAPADG